MRSRGAGPGQPCLDKVAELAPEAAGIEAPRILAARVRSDARFVVFEFSDGFRDRFGRLLAV
jgi:hypothetical protein